MDSLNDYGYVAAEIKHVHHTVIERLKEGVTVLSKAAVRGKIKSDNENSETAVAGAGAGVTKV